MQDLELDLDSKPSTSSLYYLFDSSVKAYIYCIYHLIARTYSIAATGQHNQQQQKHSNLSYSLSKVGHSFIQRQENQIAAVRVWLKAVKELDTAIKRTDGL